jgi:hypothetical protein
MQKGGACQPANTVAEDAREAMQEELRLLRWQMKDVRARLARRRVGLKYNPNVDTQPRDDRGRWVEDGRQGDDSPKDPGLVTRPALLRPTPPIRPFTLPPGVDPRLREAIESQLSRYDFLSRLNRPDARAVLGFNAGAFEPGSDKSEAAVHTAVLTRDEVEKICPRYWEVQQITNDAAASPGRGAYPSAQAYGTAVHLRIRDEINGPPTHPPSPPQDLDFRSELSVIKGEEADRYGQRGSKRVDVYENPHTGTVCIYDIKTGDTGLSFARMHELASNVGRFYPLATRIVVTEVRPRA